MDIHEYQAKDLFAQHGIPVLAGDVAETAEQAGAIADSIGGQVVVKAQVHTGGRGKAGGVKLASDSADAREKAAAILGMDIKGHIVRRVLVAQASDIASEAYVGITHDRGSRKAVIMVSSDGGVDIEETARTHPERIVTEAIEPALGLTSGQASRLGFHLYPSSKSQARAAARIIESLTQLFLAEDCTLAEINPLIVTPDGEVIALDAKVSFDDNGLARHPELEELRDPHAETDEDRSARSMGLAFHKLDGTVGCIVNGAGLAMAALDVIEHFGGAAANFLDIGGSSNPEKVRTAMEIILSDPNVRVIMFNIFGGITRCDDVARGLVSVLSSTEVPVPIVVRLTGTNEAEAQEIMKQVDVHTASTMDEAIQKAIELARA